MFYNLGKQILSKLMASLDILHIAEQRILCTVLTGEIISDKLKGGSQSYKGANTIGTHCTCKLFVTGQGKSCQFVLLIR